MFLLIDSTWTVMFRVLYATANIESRLVAVMCVVYATVKNLKLIIYLAIRSPAEGYSQALTANDSGV